MRVEFITYLHGESRLYGSKFKVQMNERTKQSSNSTLF
jgi:hypothetical protein